MTQTRPPRASDALGAWIRDRVAWARAGAAAEGLERRVIWLVVGFALVLVPALFNLARAPSFDATFHLTPQEIEPFPLQTNPAFYRPGLGDPGLEFVLRTQHGLPASTYRDATFTPDGKRIAVTVHSSSPPGRRCWPRSSRASSWPRAVATSLGCATSASSSCRLR